MDPNAVVGFPAEYEPKMDLSESSDASFWDGSGKNTGKEGSEQELKDKLDAAALAVVSVCRERAQTCLKQFFSEVLNTSVKRDSVKDDADGFCLCTYAAKPVVYPHCCFL